jgi:hypothetical protein
LELSDLVVRYGNPQRFQSNGAGLSQRSLTGTPLPDAILRIQDENISSFRRCGCEGRTQDTVRLFFDPGSLG